MTVTVPTAIQDTIAMLSTINGGADVALYLDETMKDGANWLPTLNVRGDDGYYRFPDACRTQAAAFFGPDYQAAKALVRKVNELRGLTPENVRDIIAGILGRTPR